MDQMREIDQAIDERIDSPKQRPPLVQFKVPPELIEACDEFKAKHGGSNVITRQLFSTVKDLHIYIKQLNGAVRKASNSSSGGRVSDTVDKLIHSLAGSISRELWKGIGNHRADVQAAINANNPPAENSGDDAIIKMIDSGALKIGKGLTATGLSQKLINHLELTVEEAFPESVKLRIAQREEAEQILVENGDSFIQTLQKYRCEPTPIPVVTRTERPTHVAAEAGW